MLAPQSHAIQTMSPSTPPSRFAAGAMLGEEAVQVGEQGH
jgi:hypothetical protein